MKPKHVDFDDALHRTYAEGRQLAPDVMAAWMDAVSGIVDSGSVDRVLDLGAGTGRFSSDLAITLGANVVALDPAAKMLRHRPQGIPGVLARAEALPLATHAFDVVFVSMVLHHLADVRAAAREVARVLRPEGTFILRTCFPDTVETPYHAYFPRVREIDIAILPAKSEVLAAIEEAGLTQRSHRIVRQRMDSSLQDYAQRIARRAMSPMRMISDEEFERGLAALRAAADREIVPAPVYEDIDLLAFTSVPD